MKVFLVDDEDEVRPRLARSLSELPGIRVSAAAPRAGDVLPQIIRFQPDAAIVDMRLHEGGALDLIRSIKALPHAPVVIALSTSRSPAYRSSCHKAGAEYFFDKVREQEMLSETVTRLGEEVRREKLETHAAKE